MNLIKIYDCPSQFQSRTLLAGNDSIYFYLCCCKWDFNWIEFKSLNYFHLPLIVSPCAFVVFLSVCLSQWNVFVEVGAFTTRCYWMSTLGPRYCQQRPTTWSLAARRRKWEMSSKLCASVITATVQLLRPFNSIQFYSILSNLNSNLCFDWSLDPFKTLYFNSILKFYQHFVTLFSPNHPNFRNLKTALKLLWICS